MANTVESAVAEIITLHPNVLQESREFIDSVSEEAAEIAYDALQEGEESRQLERFGDDLEDLVANQGIGETAVVATRKHPRPVWLDGKRTGRPRKSEKWKLLYESTEEQLHAILPIVPRALLELVNGVWVEEKTGRGRRIYQKQPNLQAISMLLDRTMGKVKQQVEHSGNVNVTTLDLDDYSSEETLQLLEMAVEVQKKVVEDERENTIEAEYNDI